MSGASPSSSVLDYIDERTIVLNASERDRDSMIRTLAEKMGATGRVRDADGVVAAALAREARSTTGIGEGIAIPHAKTDAVSSPVVAFARSRDGIDWNSVDGTTAELIFMIAVPGAAAGNEHLRILAELSRCLMKPAFRAAMLAAETPADILVALNETVAPRFATASA